MAMPSWMDVLHTHMQEQKAKLPLDDTVRISWEAATIEELKKSVRMVTDPGEVAADECVVVLTDRSYVVKSGEKITPDGTPVIVVNLPDDPNDVL